MPVLGIDHVNVRTADVAATLGFFRDALGLTVVAPPGCSGIDHAGWVLDGNGLAIVHVGHIDIAYPGDAENPYVPSRGGGAIHHVALSCSAYDEMRERLRRLKLAFVESHVPEVKLHQLFVHEPNGILIELNFRDE